MTSRKSTISQRIIGIAVLASVSLLLGLVAARVVSHFLLFSNNAMLGASLGLPKLASAILNAPFAIDWGSSTVRTVAGIAAAIPVLLAILGSSKGMKLDLEDTGREHGADRFATEKEMKSLVDRRHRANNIFYTEHAGLPIVAHDSRTKGTLYGKNLNMVCLGISGLGKTFNVALPSLLQSVGTSLPEMPYGARNIPAHLRLTPAWRIASALVEPASKRIEEAKRSIPKFSIGRKPAERPAHDDRWANREKSRLRSAIEAEFGTAEERAEKKKARLDALGAGFDVVNTDPKGNNVRDCGSMYEAAGYDVKVFDTVDFGAGLHYNPLAYIGERYVDIKSPTAIEAKISGSLRQCGECETVPVGSMRLCITDSPSSNTHRSGIDLSASLAISSETSSLEDVPGTTKTVYEIEEELDRLSPDDPRRDVLLRQIDVKWLEQDTGSFCAPAASEDDSKVARHEGHGCPKLATAVRSIKYRRSKGTITLELKNPYECAIDADIVIELDDAIAPTTYIPTSTCKDSSSIIEVDEAGNLVWRVRNLVASSSFGARASEKVVVNFRVKSMRVADGIALAKTVDTIVANLRGTDANSAGSQDPFWEDSKRLCLMSLFAYLFEAYDAPTRTIPSMMKLLDAALPDSATPGAKSPLEVLMGTWEHGRVYQQATSKGNARRGMLRGGCWVEADTPPHSRSDSVALHCYHAFMAGAEETVRSVIITCQAALVNLVADDVKELLSEDELHLDTLGDPDQKQALFIVTQDTDSPFDFLTALLIQQTIDLLMEKAYRRYGGRLPRHVRFELDEAANLGKIPVLVRAMAVVRSRNVSIALYLQSKSQLALVYGDKEAEVMLDNCTTMLFLGAQTKDTLEEISERVGSETVYSRTFQRSFGEAGVSRGTSESIQSTERKVQSTTQLARMSSGKLLCFVFGCYPILDDKFKTLRHPLYAYVNPTSQRSWLQPPPVFRERFDFQEYRSRKAGVES